MNWAQLRAFSDACRKLGVTPPAAIGRGLALIEVIDGHQKIAPVGLLTMSDDQIRERVTAIAIREHDRDGRASGRGMTPGADRVKKDLATEVRESTIPDLERLVDELRPKFDEHAAALVEAATVHGFTYATTSDEVINRADETASAAWRAVPKAWTAIAPIASLRIAMSALFDVSPTRSETRAAVFPSVPHDNRVNHSVCFAANDNWSLESGYYVEGKTLGHLDWLALAAGGLRLNSPAEVRAKLDERGIGSIASSSSGTRVIDTDPMAYLYPVA